MIVILAAFYGLGLILATNRPLQFVLYYILASTKFLGFIDPAQFIVGGIELGYFGLNLIAIFGIFFKKGWTIWPKHTQVIFFLIILMILFGILRPILNNYSSVKQAIIASKDAWFYSIFLYLIVYYDNLDLQKIMKFIKFISFYFTTIYLLFFIIPAVIPPYYYQDTHIRTFFPTYISLSIFFYLIELKMNDSKNYKIYLLIFYQMIGLVIAEHSNLTVMTLFCGALYLFAFDKNLRLKRENIAKILSFTIFFVALALIYVNGLYEGIVDKINAVVYSEDLALRTRDLYNEFRWKAINDEPVFGYGYIHQSSDLMATFKLAGGNAFMERFTVIDSGYVGMLIKYGYLGTGIILGVMTWYFSFGFFNKYKNHITLAMSLFLVQYLAMNYTWSVYTFSHGIIPGAIAFYIIIMYQDLCENEENIILE